jgi:hypothetical protein
MRFPPCTLLRLELRDPERDGERRGVGEAEADAALSE